MGDMHPRADGFPRDAQDTDLSGLDLVEADLESLPHDESDEADAEAGLSETGGLTGDDGIGDVEFDDDTGGVA